MAIGKKYFKEIEDEEVEIKIELPQKSKSLEWFIEGADNFTKEQLKKAHEMLESGMKPRKAALYLGIHKNKIRPI